VLDVSNARVIRGRLIAHLSSIVECLGSGRKPILANGWFRPEAVIRRAVAAEMN